MCFLNQEASRAQSSYSWQNSAFQNSKLMSVRIEIYPALRFTPTPCETPTLSDHALKSRQAQVFPYKLESLVITSKPTSHLTTLARGIDSFTHQLYMYFLKGATNASALVLFGKGCLKILELTCAMPSLCVPSLFSNGPNQRVSRMNLRMHDESTAWYTISWIRRTYTHDS